MIVSVTVCYRPDLASLERQLALLRPQVHVMLVMNNGPDDAALAEVCCAQAAQLITLGHNTGIAYAQNRGIEYAIAREADSVLLMDQDSEPADDMVYTLSRALAKYPQAAAVGPSSVDLRTQRRSYFEVDTGHWPARWQPQPHLSGQTVAAAYLIASGSLLRVSALAHIGLMREDWFIDHIDTEWSLRARSKGWTVLGVADASLGHRLGDEVTQVWWLRQRQVPHHSPVRNYYMFRNAILLIREPFVEAHWRRYHITRLFQFFFFFLAVSPQRLTRLKLMLRGIVDGLHGRTGALS